MKLTELIKQSSFSSPAQEAILSVLATSSWLLNELTTIMAPYGVTPVQYNVLRILRGSHPETLTCSEIGERLLDRMPDVTRLLDRLERAGLIERERAEHDRRVVEVRISEEGMNLLCKMEEAIERSHEDLTRGLAETELTELCRHLERLRRDQ